MKKQICSLAISTLFGIGVAIAAPQTQDPQAPPASSADNGHPRHQADPNRQLQMLTKRLNLTSDQQNKILPVLTNRVQQTESLRTDTSLSAQDRRAKMHSIREEGDTQIRAVLTDSQKQTYDQWQQQMREREMQRHEQRTNSGGTGTL